MKCMGRHVIYTNIDLCDKYLLILIPTKLRLSNFVFHTYFNPLIFINSLLLPSYQKLKLGTNLFVINVLICIGIGITSYSNAQKTVGSVSLVLASYNLHLSEALSINWRANMYKYKKISLLVLTCFKTHTNTF